MENEKQWTEFMSSKSLWEIHNGWVKELLGRGEKVLQPRTEEPYGSIWGYAKAQIPHKDAGIIFKNEKDGTFEILCDMCQYGLVGMKIEDIGLCDSRCWYEWMNESKHSTNEQECTEPNLKNVKLEDLVKEILSREDVTSQSVSWGTRFPDLSHDEWNLRTGPAKVIIIRTFRRKDGYK